MAQNKIQRGEKLQLTAPAGGVVNEMGYLIGGLFVVAQHSADEADPFTGDCEGVHELPKATGYVVTEGEVLYWDVADEEFNSDTTNEPVAIAVADAGSSATTVSALINPRNVDGAAAAARLDDLEDGTTGGAAYTYTFTGAGDQVTMSDTNTKTFTKKATVPADRMAVDDWCDWEAEVFVDSADSTPQYTGKILLGTAELESEVIATAAANDYLVMRGRGRVSGATTMRCYKGLGETKDGTLSLNTHEAPADLTIQSLDANRDVTVTMVSNAGHADNKATLKSLRFTVHKGHVPA